MNTQIKLLQRQTIDELIEECYQIVKSTHSKTTILRFTQNDRQVFNTLIMQMVASLSTIPHSLSAKSFTSEYLTIRYDIIHRMFLKEEIAGSKKHTVFQFLKECEQIANDEIGTIEELQEELKKDDAVKQLVLQ